MAIEEIDPVSGHVTTGHEWNGIKELDTPVPRGVLIFLIVTHLFAVIWWFVMPTWPLGTTYTKGLLGTDQRKIVEEKLVQANAARAPWVSAIEKSSFDEILANPQLMQVVRKTGHQLFGDNCAACHGRDGRGGDNYPDLTGPRLDLGRRAGEDRRNPARRRKFPSRGKPGVTDAFLRARQDAGSDTGQEAWRPMCIRSAIPRPPRPRTIARIEAGRQVFLTNCAACHGEDAKGNHGSGSAQSDRSILDLWRRL